MTDARLAAAASAVLSLCTVFCAPGCRQAEPIEGALDAAAATRPAARTPGHPSGVRTRFEQRAGPGGTIPPNAIWRAKLQRDAALADAPAGSAGSGPRGWRWLGPGNVGGRIRALLIHPSQPQVMWAGSASGGVWKTEDGGQSWVPLDDYPASLVIACMAMDPSDPDRIYAGTGEGYFDSVDGTSNTAAIQGAGVFLSTDGGTSWSQIAATASWPYVNKVEIHPTAPGTLIAATEFGIHRSTDRGQTWSRITTQKTFDVDIDPNDARNVVAARADGVPMFSTDGGTTWSNATGISGARRIEMAYAASNSSIVYANVTVPSRGILVFRSTDGGRSFALRSSGSGINTWSNYNSAIWVDPTNSNRIVYGGVNVYRSTDGGVNRTNITSSVHVDFHVFVAHPGYDGAQNRTLFSGNDGGVYRTSDPFASSASWVGLNNNLGCTQFYGAAIHPGTGVVLGGTQDNGTIRFGGDAQGDPQGWTRTFGGDGGFCAADPTDPNVFYGETQRLRIFRSRDAGRSGSYIYNRSSNPIDESSPNFIPYFLLDPNDSDRMLAAGASLWRSNDVKSANAPNWFVIKPALTCTPTPDQAHFQDNAPCNISTVAVADGDPDVVWVGHNHGHLYRTSDGTAGNPTWTRVDGGSPLPDRWISRIVIDPNDHRRVFVAFMGYASDNLWRTLDGGATWTSVGGSGANRLPDIPVPAFAVHPTAPGYLFAGTDLGLFWSLDDGASWTTSSDGSGLASIDELVWRDRRRLLVVTHGRGAYEADLGAASTRSVGSACGAGAVTLLTAAPPVLGLSQAYTVFASPNAPVTLLFAPGGASATDLGNGCTLQVPPGGAIAVPAGATGPTGIANHAIAVPDDPTLIGARLTAQAFAAAAGGPLFGLGDLTNAVEMTLGL